MARVIFTDLELKNAFKSLSDEDPIKKALKRAFEDIENNFRIGRPVTKDVYNKKGIKSVLKKYGVDNLRIYNLPSAWRLIYSVSSDQIEIIAIILDWMDHKEYDRLFK